VLLYALDHARRVQVDGAPLPQLKYERLAHLRLGPLAQAHVRCAGGAAAAPAVAGVQHRRAEGLRKHYQPAASPPLILDALPTYARLGSADLTAAARGVPRIHTGSAAGNVFPLEGQTLEPGAHGLEGPRFAAMPRLIRMYLMLDAADQGGQQAGAPPRSACLAPCPHGSWYEGCRGAGALATGARTCFF